MREMGDDRDRGIGSLEAVGAAPGTRRGSAATRRDFLRMTGAAFLGVSGCTGTLGEAGRSWSASTLSRADALARRHGGKGWGAWSGGRRVAGWNDDFEGPILSITKVIAALAAAKAAGEGWLDAGERAAETLTEWRGDALKRRITVGMLLQQTAGLENGVAALYRNAADKGSAAIALRVVDMPGTFFRYGPACWEVLAELLRRKLSERGRTLEEFLTSEVMRPLGVHSPDWRSDRRGRFFLSTGAQLSVTELGTLGRAIGSLLRGRNVAGIGAEHFAAMTRSSPANPMFGGGLWKNSRAGGPGAEEIEVEDALDPPASRSFWQRACLSRKHPADLVALIGSSGRRVYIWPSEDKVVARHGTARSWVDRPFLSALA